MFEQAIKSEVTRKGYLYQLTEFRKWANIKDFNGLLEAPEKDIQILLEDYVMYLKKKISPNSIPIYFAPIELFYVMNDVNVNFKKIRKLFPDKVKKGNERGYSHGQVQTILNASKTKRHKALVLLLASSGCRIGAIPDIRLKHLTKIEDCYSIKIYEGDKEEDFIFTTPEASLAIDAYLDERRKDGEYIDGESTLFRTIYRLGIEKVIPCSVDLLSHTMARLVKVVDRKKSGKTNRYEIAKSHGFRKFFATIIKNTDGISPTMTEKLINHVGIVQMDGAYFTPSVEQMFSAYKKAIPDLLIDQTHKHEIKIKELEDEKLEFQRIKDDNAKLKEDNVEIKEKFLELKEISEKLVNYIEEQKSNKD